MNNIDPYPRLYTSVNNNTNYLIFEIFVDGQMLVDFTYYAVDLEEITKSISHDGQFYIITCHCGVPGCAGIGKGIEVLHAQGLVLWTIREPIPLRTLTWEQKMYHDAIFTAIQQSKQLMAQAMHTSNQKIEVVPMQNERLLAIK